jgi:chemotaxis protein methyltransferase CheR
VEGAVTSSAETLSYLRDLVYDRSAIVLQSDKAYLVDSRLAPVAREAGFSSVDELVAGLKRDGSRSPLVKRVVEAMTTNETLFFRDLHPFEALKSRILPELIRARAGQKTLRIWCAAASTGQEPYSIAMVVREHFPELGGWDVRITATDINAAVLQRARAGIYRQLEVDRGLPAGLLLKYFERRGADWQVKATLKHLVQFVELNLLDAWTQLSPQDVVFMRNVLIYFDAATKRRLLARARDILRPDGFLILGGAESTNNLDDRYTRVRIGSGIYYQVISGCGK